MGAAQIFFTVGTNFGNSGNQDICSQTLLLSYFRLLLPISLEYSGEKYSIKTLLIFDINI
jgi:hypothetical protein